MKGQPRSSEHQRRVAELRRSAAASPHRNRARYHRPSANAAIRKGD